MDKSGANFVAILRRSKIQNVSTEAKNTLKILNYNFFHSKIYSSIIHNVHYKFAKFEKLKISLSL